MRALVVAMLFGGCGNGGNFELKLTIVSDLDTDVSHIVIDGRAAEGFEEMFSYASANDAVMNPPAIAVMENDVSFDRTLVYECGPGVGESGTLDYKVSRGPNNSIDLSFEASGCGDWVAAARVGQNP